MTEGLDAGHDWTRLAGRIVDLSLDLVDDAPSYPGDPRLSLSWHDHIAESGYSLTSITMGSHQGTHLDAPSHFFEDGATVDQIDLRRCVGPALLVDLSRKKARDPITPYDLEPWHERIGPDTRLVFRTGWDAMLFDPGYFHDFPVMTVELALWLVERGVRLVGMDTPSPALDESTEVHRILLGAGIVIVEELAHLDRLGVEEFVLIAIPLRLVGGDGSPIRALGLTANV